MGELLGIRRVGGLRLSSNKPLLRLLEVDDVPDCVEVLFTKAH